METTRRNVAVVGGGLAGLTAATYLARAGRVVTLFEKSHTLGGRAVTQTKSGFRFNLGPHALYRKGHAADILRDLGVRFSGAVPSASGRYAVAGGMKHAFPGGFVSLLTTGLLGLPGKLEVARLLSGIHRIDAAAARHTTVAQWLERSIRQPDVRRLLQALFRVATYTHAPQRQSAGAAIAQLQMALSGNVLYLDDGWQTLVDGLRAAAAAAGVRIVTATRVEAVECDGAVRGVHLAGGVRLPAAAVVVAGSPEDAAALVPPQHAAVLRDWAAAAVPVRVACLDAGLARLPRPRGLFALGIDRPLYLSVHSAVAKLAPPGAATVLVGRYLDPDADDDGGTDARDLEALLDGVQPGWRDVVVERRFLPSLTVSHALVTAAAGGTAGRPGPAVPNVSGLYVAGDWVGAEGMLADAALASAKRAAQQIAAEQARLAAA